MTLLTEIVRYMRRRRLLRDGVIPDAQLSRQRQRQRERRADKIGERQRQLEARFSSLSLKQTNSAKSFTSLLLHGPWRRQVPDVV